MKNKSLIIARKKANLSQDQLAKLLGYKGRQSVSNWESGNINPPLNVALKISEILKVDVKDIFFEKEVQEICTN